MKSEGKLRVKNKPQIKLNRLKKSLASLQEALQSPLLQQSETSIFMRDAVVQRFEYTYEPSRNLIRRILEHEFGEKDFTVRDGYRLAARYGMLDDVENWFQYQEARNLTSHRYEERIAEETFLIAKMFAVDAEKLLKKLEIMLNDKSHE